MLRGSTLMRLMSLSAMIQGLEEHASHHTLASGLRFCLDWYQYVCDLFNLDIGIGLQGLYYSACSYCAG